jgi:23S rRNA (uracil1939-C5)-methyltransferase
MSKKNKKVIVNNLIIDKYAAEGKCIAKYNDKVVFVAGVVPGDVVDVLLVKNKKDWAEGIVQKFISYADTRIQPICEHFGVCGGCKWQMLPYTLQAQYKQQQVADQLQRIGQVKHAQFLPIVAAHSSALYRNKLEFTFSNKRYLTSAELNNPEASSNANVLGYHAPRLFDKVIDIQQCQLQIEPQNQIRNGLRQFALENQLSFFDIKAKQGLLRNLMIRTTTTGHTLVNIIFGEADDAGIEMVLNYLSTQHSDITSLYYTINTKANDTIYDLEVKLYKGLPQIIEQLGEFKFNISPKSFFQTNTNQAKALYDVVVGLANFTGGEVLYDLYCGTGSIGIYCSKHISKLIGVDSVEQAIEDATINAELNNIQNAHFEVGDVINICTPTFFAQHGTPDIVITDPPRAGMHQQLIDTLLNIAAPRIVYVSCNPATQARDLVLLQKAYDVITVQAVDMFPHTHHVESVALLQLKN